MSGETAASSNSRTNSRPNELTGASAALIVAGIPFYIGGLLVIQTDTPPSLSPTLGMLSHALWALAIAILALGVVSLVRGSTRSDEVLRAFSPPDSSAWVCFTVCSGSLGPT